MRANCGSTARDRFFVHAKDSKVPRQLLQALPGHEELMLKEALLVKARRLAGAGEGL